MWRVVHDGDGDEEDLDFDDVVDALIAKEPRARGRGGGAAVRGVAHSSVSRLGPQPQERRRDGGGAARGGAAGAAVSRAEARDAQPPLQREPDAAAGGAPCGVSPCAPTLGEPRDRG